MTFNRLKLLFLFRLSYACLYELYLIFFSGHDDSWFLDSPLWYDARFHLPLSGLCDRRFVYSTE